MAEDNHDHAKEEEEMQRLAYLQNLYGQQYEAILGELTNMGMLQAALHRSIELIKHKDRAKGANILVNAESGMYLEANVKDITKVITYVGGGYLVEKDVEKAREFLDKNLATIDENAKKLLSDKQKLEDELMRIQYSMELMQQHQGHEHV